MDRRLAASAAAWSVACAALATPEGASRGVEFAPPLPPLTPFGPSPFGRTDCVFAVADATACSCKSSLAYSASSKEMAAACSALSRRLCSSANASLASVSSSSTACLSRLSRATWCRAWSAAVIAAAAAALASSSACITELSPCVIIPGGVCAGETAAASAPACRAVPLI